MSGDGAVPSRRPIRANPIRNRKDWEAAREAAFRDPGAFHGEIAKREIYWLDRQLDDGSGGAAWVKRVDGAAPWVAFDAATGARVASARPAAWAPWTTAFDEAEAPF